MKKFLIDLSQQRRYWVVLILLGLALEAAALYYQYVLNEWPCVLCIHIRVWILGIIALGVIALLVHRWKGMVRLMHGVNILLMIGLVERCWQVLAVERGWVFGNCDMESGLPAWFALDKWFPAIFEVQAACGYTPYILLNISMAEILMAISAALLVFSCTIFSLSWASPN